MALTVTSPTGTGKGASRPLFTRTARALEVFPCTVDFDSSYPTGGEAFNAESESGFSDIVQVWVAPTDGFTFEYVDSATAADRKIKAFWVDTTTDGAAQAEVANATDLQTVTGVQVLVWGYR